MAGGSPMPGQQQVSSGPGRGGSGGVMLRTVESISDLYRTPSFFQRAKAARAHNNSITDATVSSSSPSVKPLPGVGGSPQWRAVPLFIDDDDDWDPAWNERSSQPPPPPSEPPLSSERSSLAKPRAACCPCRLRVLIGLLILVSLVNLGVAACALYWAVVAHNETRGLRGVLADRAAEVERLGAHGP